MMSFNSLRSATGGGASAVFEEPLKSLYGEKSRAV